MRPRGLRRGLLAIAVAASAVTVGATVTTSAAPEAAAPERPPLSLRAAGGLVTLERYDGFVYLDLGMYVVAGDESFEIHAKRPSYSRPIQASQIKGDRTVSRPGLKLTDFRGLPGFFHLVIKNAAGRTVIDRYQRFCPNGETSSRLRPDAPATSPYPSGCPTHPFTLGSVWGIQEGWGAPQFDWEARPARLKRGRYTATLSIAPRYRRMFGIPDASASRTARVRVVKGDFECPDCEFGNRSGLHAHDASAHPIGHRSTATTLKPPGSEPTGANVVPTTGPLPDLRSLPAFSIFMESRRRVKRDFLVFGANVWNAGDSPLVVDGFRRPRQRLMDAYQYFYDTDGNETGHARTGSMEWDARPGHRHWHFLDFARYRLLDSDKKAIVRSRKEAFCLANTDAVDYTVPGANWRPFNTELHTSCGEASSLSIREVLDQGSGDSYYQYLPGQSFNVTSLPNGTYYVEVTANPLNRLHESDRTNNVSYRKVILRGKPGARTVRVPKVGLVEEQGGGGF